MSRGSILRRARGQDQLPVSLYGSFCGMAAEGLRPQPAQKSFVGSCLVVRGPGLSDCGEQPIVLHEFTGMWRLNHPLLGSSASPKAGGILHHCQQCGQSLFNRFINCKSMFI